MKKRLLILLISVLSLVCAAVFLSACGEEEEPTGGGSSTEYKPGDSIIDDKDVEYEVKDGYVTVRYADKKYEITYLMDNSSYLKLTGTKPTELSLSGYAGDITSISLADLEDKIKIGETAISVSSVADRAFQGCESLTSVDLTKKNMSLDFEIGLYAFAYCPNITTVKLPTNVYTNSNAVGSFAFFNNTKLANVSIGDKFSELGDCSFAFCTSLTSVTVPDRVSVIRRGAFMACEALTSVTLPAQLKSIQSQAFENTALTSVGFGSNVRYIGESAFAGTDISTLKIPASVTYIGSKAFYNCAKLTDTEIPFLGNSLDEPMTYVEIYGFDAPTDTLAADVTEDEPAASAVQRKVKVNGTAYIPENAFSYCDYITSLDIAFCEEGRYKIYNDDGVTFTSMEITPSKQIGSYAFYDCSSLTEAPALTEEITAIGDYAYYGCTNVTTVAVPATVRQIGMAAFGDCRNLGSLEIKAYSAVTKIRQGDIDTNIVTSLGAVSKFFGTTTLYPETPTAGGQGTMYSANGRYIPNTLTTVKLGDVYSIPANMFNGWRSLTTADITYMSDEALGSVEPSFLEDQPQGIGDYAFADCELLTSAPALAEGVKTIGAYAYGGCAKIKNISVPSTVIAVGNAAFADCAALESLEVKSYSRVVKSAGGSYATYAVKSLDAVSSFFGLTTAYPETVTTQNGTTTYDYGPMYRAVSCFVPKTLKTVNLGNVYTVAPSMFGGWNRLENVTVAFTSASALSAANINSSFIRENPRVIGVSAFYGCSKLKTLSVTEGGVVSSIYASAFSGCAVLPFSAVAQFSAPESIGADAFSGCAAFTEVTIPASVKTLSIDVFYDCPNITALTVNSYSYYDSSTYSYKSLGNIYGLFGANRYSDDYEASKYYSAYDSTYVPVSLKTVTLKNAVSLANNAFYGMSRLTAVTVEFNSTQTRSSLGIGQSAFSGCDSLTALKLDSGTKNVTLGSGAFYNCNMLKELEVRADYYPKGVLYGCNSLEKLSINIPSSSSYAYRLGEFFTTSSTSNTGHAQYVPATLKTVKLLDGGSEYIPDYMFYNCENLASVEFADVTNVGRDAFTGCTGLDKETAGGIVTYNDWIVGLVSSASYTRSIVIPASVKGVADYTFNNTSNLVNVYYRGASSAWRNITKGSNNSYLTNKTPVYLTSANSYTDGNVIYYIDTASTATPLTASVIFIDPDATAAELKSSVTIGGVDYAVTAIGAYAGCNQNLKYIYVPVSVIEIGSNALINSSSVRIYYAGTSSSWTAVSGYSSLSSTSKQYETENTSVTYTYYDGNTKLKETSSLFAEYYAPEKAGYRFDGWYENSSLTTSVGFPFYASVNTAFYAKWTQLYTIKFVSNGGTAYADKELVPNNSTTLSTPSRSGFTFGGWFASSSFSGSRVDYPSQSYTPRADTTLYAKWTRN